jgi:hypothetical protein
MRVALDTNVLAYAEGVNGASMKSGQCSRLRAACRMSISAPCGSTSCACEEKVTNAKRVRSESSAEGPAENPLPDGTKKRPAVEDNVTEPATKPGRTELQRLWQEKWEELENCRIREEELADAGLLVQPLIPTRVRLSYECLAIIRELQRIAVQRLLKQSTLVGQPSAQVPGDEDDGTAGEIVTTDPMTTLCGLIIHSWEALELCRVGEELLDEKGLPTHCLAAARAQLGKVMDAFMREHLRNEAQAFFIKHVVGSEGCPAAPLSDATKQALKAILQQFSPRDRRVLRQLLDRARPAEMSSSAEDS